MKIVYYSTFLSILQLLPSNCVENNVCKTIQDYYTINNNENCEYDIAADPHSDPTTIIEFYGYPVETHKVTTLDGYILTMFRIPNSEVSFNTSHNMGPVILQPGFMTSATSYLALGKDSLAFLLADAGYDVWLGNYRGNEYSEEHVNLTVFNKQYWDYSADEIGLYDIPAMLGYISKISDHNEKIIYIGHSLGTTVAMMYASTFPEKAKNTLKLLILLSPGAQFTNSKAPLFRIFPPLYRPLLKILLDKHLIRFASQAKVLKSITRFVCFQSPYHLQHCGDALNIFVGGPHGQLAPKSLPVLLNVLPSGGSFKLLPHAADWVKHHFARYNYGYKRNYKIYGSSKPPSYDLKKITVPVFLAYAINDWATTAEDSRNLYDSLSPKAKYGQYEIRVTNFNHFDFIIGQNVKLILYDVLLQVLDRINH